jgi:hypothetical protein
MNEVGIWLPDSLNTPASDTRIPRAPIPQSLSAPTTMREVFTLLARTGPERPLDAVLARVDFSRTTAASLRTLLLDQPVSDAGGDDDPATAFRRTLVSRPFRERAVPAFLNAFPELAREIFVHVPKCAGTDLTYNLRARMLAVQADLLVAEWTADEDFVGGLAALARAAPHHTRILVHGHIELGPFMRWCGHRPTDHVFSVLRDPVALMISHANFRVGRLLQDPEGHDADTAETLEKLGLARLPNPMSDQDVKDLTVRVLLDSETAPHNLACRHLGRGFGSDFVDAFRNIVAHDVELTTTDLYEPWLRRRWNIGRSERHNRSIQLLTVPEARRLCASYLRDATGQDQILFDLVSWAIGTNETHAVTGRRLALLAGARPIAPLVRDLAARRADRAAAPSVVLGHQAITSLRCLPSVVPAGAPRPRRELSAPIHAGSPGTAYLRGGWSRPEPEFVWSQGHESTLALPARPGRGTLVVRLIGVPFVYPRGGLTAQRIELSINGRVVGGVTVPNLAAIEFEVPADLASGPLDVTLGLPGARRASELNGSGDRRVLGFALREVSLVRYEGDA